ncbi:methionyl-tRNA formyltransferase [Candidatus Pantoea edessiphila]|uniref:Methionyl-tRNA formyltransferase n=1 Tax=Candidatus Pantoea edessiphila TaxID=2044610 RepID=A0A2P5T1Y7_9GAMM|nr:methionyl-tRNA formyltransferase [Candidatus Pantoea edessiphila]PPI88576.1 methionyl-tRNA formyltransferase [Candidatus Pantoea edessiphila]
MIPSLKIIFAGTSDFAVSYLNDIITSNHIVLAVFTQPDRPSGRGYKLKYSPIKIFAQSKNIPIFQPKSLDCKLHQNIISNFNPDIMVVVSYGLIIPNTILKIPRLGCINIHASLLPRWRGAAPIQRAILAGDKKTGITIIKMDEKLDTGNILYQIDCDISLKDTTLTLYNKLKKLGSQGLFSTFLKLYYGNINSKKQDEKLASYAKKIKKKEAKINWNFSAKQLERCIRAFNPWPISFFYVNNQLIKVWKVSILAHVDKKPGEIIKVTKQGIQVATTQGIINLICLQPAGKKPMTVKELINSRNEVFKPSTQLN